MERDGIFIATALHLITTIKNMNGPEFSGYRSNEREP